VPSSESKSGAGAAFAPFAGVPNGWDDKRNDHGRPTTLSFAPDGRLFIGDDTTGDIIWIAPIDSGDH
jgi:hypothetical protein